jgi:RNA polymerase sigma-70 factor (TIGR02943 family)
MSDNTILKEDDSPAKGILNIKGWVDSYGDCLYNYAAFRVNNTDEAQDLVQETFLSGIKAKDTFRGECSEKTWLVTILKRKIIDHYRKKSIQSIQTSIDSGAIAAGYEQFFHQDGDFEDNWTSNGKPQSWSVSGLQKMETKEFYDVLNKCLSVLPQKWASVFCMKNMEDMETENICKELNVSTSNYWIIMHRAKLQLRKCIETGWFGVNK